MGKWINIFRVGTHTDNKGRTKFFSDADLNRILSSSQGRDAPMVLGHPATDDPAYGWVDGLRRAGEFLQAKFRQVPEALRQAVDAGRYRNVSIALRPDMSLRHVGLLGAVPPAVDGLGPVTGFGDSEEYTAFEFNDSGASPGQPEDDMDPKQFKTLEEALARITELEAENGTLKAEAAKAKESAEQASSAAEGAKAEFAALSKRFDEFTAKTERAAREGRFDRLAAEKKVLPAERDKTLRFASSLAKSGETYEFSAADGMKDQLSAEEAFWRELEAREPHDLDRTFSAPADTDGDGVNPQAVLKTF